MKPGLRYRFTVLSRILAGLGGGYVLTSLTVVLVSLCLPGSRASAVVWATMAGFLVYALVIMAVFHARSVVRAWGWIIGMSMPLALLIFLLTRGGPNW